MSGNSFSLRLCEHIISNQQKDLFIIFENFSDKVSDPENNIFFRQNEILDHILHNIQEHSDPEISFPSLFKGLSREDIDIINSLDIRSKIANNSNYSKILNIDYFDEEIFMNILDNELKNIKSKYNLNANDDYNKLYKFLSSIQLLLQSSYDVLISLTNQYTFFQEHSKYSNKKCKDEFITIYGEKHYKIDILEKVLDSYRSAIQKNKRKTNGKKRGKK